MEIRVLPGAPFFSGLAELVYCTRFESERAPRAHHPFESDTHCHLSGFGRYLPVVSMKFNRCPWPKDHTVEMTPRRVAAARRRLAKAREAVALLPDLVAEVPKLDDDLAALKTGLAESANDWRDHWANNWRAGRKALSALPSIVRMGVLRYWSEWSGPRSPEYFRTLVAEAAKGKSYWSQLRRLRIYRLIGEKRYPEHRIREVFAGELVKPLPLGRGPGFYAKRREEKRRRRISGVGAPERSIQMPLVACA